MAVHAGLYMHNCTCTVAHTDTCTCCKLEDFVSRTTGQVPQDSHDREQ